MSHQDLTHSMTGAQGEYLKRAYELNSTAAAHDLYSEWAASYDKDLTSGAYASPLKAVEAYLAHLSSATSTQTDKPALTVLDAGCGTGMVAECLIPSAQLTGQSFIVDGVDLTPGMLDVAREKDIYRKLSTADLNELLMIVDGTYDAVLCVGTLTKGHVGPRVFAEFVRVVKAQSGLVVATVHGEIWESGGYRAEVEGLQSAGDVDVLSTAEFGLIEGQSRGGRMVVLRKK
ncbi:Putative S-adenosyl-L-methionine-dependent methyltransferase, Methyltransferase domain 25 [Septoria linicola]|uniref:S-adenosyl-L-methionine-dependent methyltransferase, Methyltransferase domain 25 n=1 Tax=Septoria linicola TaxID=215465 RepID=A0A9Q9EKL9_9PEZI|nr:putative S-adenosyl-L-methionine-dependent methyltransferase, Methyltransferase domain 25 [Septoria linicola]USW54946.1 Putative S-adenosyl-L-methionine-dependent methyltransferase, Methyltransferase domain 25 [Septoria linicola]